MTRSIPRWLAPIVEELELDRPLVVTTSYVAELRERRHVAPPPNRIIENLSERGWLLKTEAQGAWEFIPAERAGALSSGDPLLALRATLATNPELRVALALGSALWMHDLAERQPDTPEVAIPSDVHVPIALRRAYRTIRFDSRIEPAPIQGVPVHKPATILVHLAHKPSDVRSWTSVLEVLPELVTVADENEVVAELDDRAHATHVRLAYLISELAPDLIARLQIEPAGKVWFGPRGKLRRHNARWNVADTVLPVPPDRLPAS